MSKTYHFIGIKGSGMSALALMLHQMEHKVQGSDVEKYYFTQRGLEQAGITILPFSEDNITEDMELIVGNAFREDNNNEVAYAIQHEIPFKRYHEFLGDFMKQFISFGVAGAHGKTSTTGLLSHVLKNITDTSYLIGDGTGRGSANAQYFVFESDEYERHFMPYHPEYSIITNIDFDHPDYFTGIDDVRSAFNDYAKQVKKALFVYGEDQELKKITANAPIYYYGFEEGNDFVASDIARTTHGSDFTVKHDGQIIGRFHVPAYGRHNILNATAVIANLFVAGIDMELVAEHLKTFSGVKRRFTEKLINETIIIDDFAHHPTEIVATIDAARQKYPNKEIVAIFQPHTFTRTIALLDDFALALNEADSVYLAQIYGSAREVDKGEVKVEDLAAKLTKPAKIVTVDNVSPLLDHDNAVYVFMGAGDIQLYERSFEELLANLTKNNQ
ncbi:UDP-N-acetylmuramate--L-alanine ligase [Streptococcus dysgalactiae subsp. dysgalactiae]|uniref:UDP-N-acetylmuramate--L-alanine ligase n=1 Tax=Streptococcus dysgalactiae TaxID=1334 RepID=UPI000219E14F|nr:UDP-N-acetylmuramate--L-alanine ligase [Streptococcus dysgalactiae]EGR87387.1 UDP-N-acetylmuramate--L-alanine ligase [Streptococcus dysgalactiae subsp. equisimilis SK1250]KKC23682.1 UDP-N-acetylmuramate--alanine ligase [Streptococcus dysgalactiae subsp. equisimilis]MBM6514351.1 UDP-N-acetylmuramate--L-alanine ligase [Streptococcus dysgalactiae subsp. equisimilis]MBM6533884.1 UDP-N-acetylmuramate--L-alanine ligase [Streptococcus dysgalactiae subsp. equisimilis]MCY7219728.1 UDP-N-acetylmurama